MALPFFFEEQLSGISAFKLSEETLKHIQVLRIQAGDQIKLTNGKGQLVTAELILARKNDFGFKAITSENINLPNKKTSIAISLIKNNSRFEWFLEKATEIGVSEIIPLICERTEKQHFKYGRMKSILISAMLQSQQAWLPLLHEPKNFAEFINQSLHKKKYIAHCIDKEKKLLINEFDESNDRLILIGPEGDFTKEEIKLAEKNNFIPVSLGNTRLRTETAGVVAAVLLNN